MARARKKPDAPRPVVLPDGWPRPRAGAPCSRCGKQVWWLRVHTKDEPARPRVAVTPLSGLSPAHDFQVGESRWRRHRRDCDIPKEWRDTRSTTPSS